MYVALPHSKYYGEIRLLDAYMQPLFRLVCTSLLRGSKISQVPDITLHTYHALGPRQTLENHRLYRFPCIDFHVVNHVVICFSCPRTVRFDGAE